MVAGQHLVPALTPKGRAPSGSVRRKTYPSRSAVLVRQQNWLQRTGQRKHPLRAIAGTAGCGTGRCPSLADYVTV